MTRREFSTQTKREALRFSGGKCRCGARFAVAGVHFDHVIADSIGGEPTLENCEALCLKCHRTKSDKTDTPRAAKCKRQSDKHSGIRKSSRPMAGSRASKWKRKMSGETVLR